MDMAMRSQPAVATGRTVDTEGLKAFMRQQGVNGSEDDILSILEGQPSQKVMNDMVEFINFYQTGEDPKQMEMEIMLEHYLQWNNINVDKSQILAFSIKES